MMRCSSTQRGHKLWSVLQCNVACRCDQLTAPSGMSLSVGADPPASVFYVRFTVYEQANVRAHVVQAARELRIGGSVERTSTSIVVVLWPGD